MTTPYQDLLAVAVAAARAAGALLRADFLKPGGPSGHGGHAEADEPAEQLIRTHLLAATPAWSYLGEETGSVAGGEGHHCWLVDPNDGTRAYLEGYRGAAISIALLRDGVPVLGVVYAYAAPDNGGDLFAWAEGGPLLRNDQPVARRPWATEITPETVVLVSHKADRAPGANLAAVAPGRYRAIASIAYRLALAAAGEGEVGSSLNTPGGWDYAGGHALLRAVGGDLVNERGEPVTYTRIGHSSTHWCFGGAPDLVRTLASRNWGGVVRAPSGADEPYRLASPARGETIADNGLLIRAQGCLLGQLAGDALGSMVEFMGAAEIRRRYPGGLREIGPSTVFHTLAGQPTDDSELALIVARTLLQTGRWDDEAVATAYGWWRDSRPFDIGNTIGQATDAIRRAKAQGQPLAPAARTGANGQSQANGALMRQSPLAIFGHALPPEALDQIVRADTILTHPHQVCQDASAALIVALAAVIREGLDGEAAYARAVAWDAEHGQSPVVTRALAQARSAPPAFESNIGHVPIALQNAFYQALHAASLEEGVVATVMGGGDTDTNAAIAGALLGALHGARAIPDQWRRALLSGRPQAGAAEVQQPRPAAFWPVDALVLAERLLVAGARGASTSGTASPNRQTLEHLFATGAIRLQRGRLFDTAPGPLPATVPWDRVEGMLLGLAIGDALGNPTEGLLPGERREYHGEIRDYLGEARHGLPSDDSQLAFWTLEQLLADGGLAPEHLGDRFCHGHIEGIGSTMRAFLRCYKRRPAGASWYTCGVDSLGNGALMRIAPLLLPHLRAGTTDLWVDTALAAMLTHNSFGSTAACLAFVAMLRQLLVMDRPPAPAWWPETYVGSARELEGEARYRPRGGAYAGYEGPLWRFVEQHVAEAYRSGRSAEAACNAWHSGAYLLETVPSVLFILMRHGHDPEAAIIRAVNDTKDNDTVAAIVGAAVGALHGTSALPERWRAGLLGRTTAHDDGQVFRLIEQARQRWWPADGAAGNRS